MDQQVLGTVQLHYFCHFEKWHQKQTAKPLFDTTNPKKLGTNYIAFLTILNILDILTLYFVKLSPRLFCFGIWGFWWSTSNIPNAGAWHGVFVMSPFPLPAPVACECRQGVGFVMVDTSQAPTYLYHKSITVLPLFCILTILYIPDDLAPVTWNIILE